MLHKRYASFLGVLLISPADEWALDSLPEAVKIFEMISFAFTRAKVIVRERFKPSSIFAPSAVEFLAHEMHLLSSGSIDRTAESFQALGIHRRTKGVCTYLAVVTRAWRRRHSVVS